MSRCLAGPTLLSLSHLTVSSLKILAISVPPTKSSLRKSLVGLWSRESQTGISPGILKVTISEGKQFEKTLLKGSTLHTKLGSRMIINDLCRV